jgi:hypothetical protein
VNEWKRMSKRQDRPELHRIRSRKPVVKSGHPSLFGEDEV